MKKSQAEKEQQGAASTHLNLQQYQAIEMTLIGKSDIEVGQLVGVESDTIWQWRNQNPEFIIATSALRAAAWEGSVERLRRLRDRALTVVEKAVDRDDEIAAISFLQGLMPVANLKEKQF